MLRASREIRAPLEGEYVEGDVATPAKRESQIAFETTRYLFIIFIFTFSQQERLARVEDRSQLALWGRDGRRRRGCCGNPTGETFLKALSTDFQLTFD